MMPPSQEVHILRECLIFAVIFRTTTVIRVIKTKDDVTLFLLRRDCSETDILHNGLKLKMKKLHTD